MYAGYIFRYYKPELTLIKFGKVNNTIFATSLIYFKRKWFLYYGGGDKAVGLAVIKNII